MLNKNNERELAYLVKVEAITPMNADRLECAHIGGWHCVVGKGEFKVGDPAVYFEVDSQLPDVVPFSGMEFLRSKNFKIKTQKIRGEYSQGLLMPVSAFGWTIEKMWDAATGEETTCVDNAKDGELYCFENESRFLTKKLNVTYADPGDNTRKSSGPDKYKKMAGRHPEIFKKKWARWLMKREWGRKLLFFFFGKKRDKKGAWPSWVKKTDEERIENCEWLLKQDQEWVITEKIDGTSTTFALKGKDFYVCSRNVVFDRPDKGCYYDTNVYTEMAQKYDMENKLKKMLAHKKIQRKDCVGVIVQAETYGAGIQRRDYGMKDHDMAIFNIIFVFKDGHQERLNPLKGKDCAAVYDLPYVPVLGQFKLPDNCDGMIALAAEWPSKIDGGMREGLVCRSLDGVQSFKAVSREYLVKYHG
jgi:hypothetical protein